MTDSLKCTPQETEVCCCVDVGTILDNKDCVASVEQIYASRSDADAALQQYVAKARDVESDPCLIESDIQETGNGVVLKAQFVFCCQAENLIFQLALR